MTTPQALFSQAVAFHQSGQVVEAEQLYRQLIGSQPLAPEPRQMMGILRLQQGRNAEALEFFGGALKINPNNAETLANAGNALKALGRMDEALAAYDQAMAKSPGSANLLYNRSLLLQDMGRHAEAMAGYDQALAITPDFFQALHNRGTAFMDMGRTAEAAVDLQKAVALRPDSPESWNNLGNALFGLERFDESLVSYDKALALRPDFAKAHFNRGNLLQAKFGRSQEAVAAYDKALAINPVYLEVWNNRGNALRELGRLEEAMACFDKALELRSDLADPMKGRSQLFFEMDRIDDGLAAFRDMAAQIYGTGQSPLGGKHPLPDYKLRHDEEQHAYQQAQSDVGRAGARLAGPAITRPAQGEEISRQWRTMKPQLAVIDNLLTPEALASLRKFCLEQPVWRAPYRNGYLGAFPQHGFACPLLGQIAEELRENFPAIFGLHPLLYLWGFKYDSQMSGIGIHADEAAVNVNFWLTPDNANLDPDSGGLVVWDKAAPLDWNFVKFNTDEKAIRDYLEKSGAKPVRVPYRANRAVIFDSDLFHETDTIRFREGYENRRINVTMLYGRRAHGDAP